MLNCVLHAVYIFQEYILYSFMLTKIFFDKVKQKVFCISDDYTGEILIISIGVNAAYRRFVITFVCFGRLYSYIM